MIRTDFCLFFSMPLSAQDWINLSVSGVVRVMLPLSLAYGKPDIPRRLGQMGRRLVLRLEETYYSDDAPLRVSEQVKAVQALCPVEAVILGVEPDNAFDATYASPDWGQDWAYQHRNATALVANALPAGVKRISAGHTMRSISEDEPPAPGREAWAEICRPVYSQLDGNAMHLYGYSSDGNYVNTLRALFALKMAQERFHKPIYIDEIAFASGTPVERMRAVLSFARLLERHPLGERVRMLCPFVSNGDGKAYDPRLIIREEAAYTAIGEYINGSLLTQYAS